MCTFLHFQSFFFSLSPICILSMKTALIFLAVVIGFAAAEYGEKGYTPAYVLRNYFERQQFSKWLQNQAFSGYGYGLGEGLGLGGKYGLGGGYGLGWGYGLSGGLGYGYGVTVGGLGGYSGGALVGGTGYGYGGYGKSRT